MKKHAFSLIELWVVLAVIAILIANTAISYSRASLRSKLSRIDSDLRILSKAAEAYRVDHEYLPPAAGEITSLTTQKVGARVIIDGQVAAGVSGWWLSTPTAYIQDAWIKGPLVEGPYFTSDIQVYPYHTYTWRWPLRVNGGSRPDSQQENFNEGMTGFAFKELYGTYRFFSVSPDQDYNNDEQQP